jgi:Uncharacterized protein conserved in bacteria
MTFDSYAVYAEHIRAGKVRALGVTSLKRISALPEVPAISEAGLDGYDVSNWLGVVVPKGTPQSVVQRLNEAIAKGMADENLKRQLGAMGIEATSSTPEEFAATVKREIPKWAQIVKKSGATVD